ncbi:hypothetical protein [Simplicispira piscis]|jgi:hypothetical protein
MNDDSLVAHVADIPLAIADSAFHACLRNTAVNGELIANFKRLTGFDQIDHRFAREFVGFVHEYVYMRLDEQSISAMRTTAN